MSAWDLVNPFLDTKIPCHVVLRSSSRRLEVGRTVGCEYIVSASLNMALRRKRHSTKVS